MPQLIYNWKRFWCLRDGGFHIDANGFLVRSEYFKDNTVEFESIAGTPCLVLLGEPGIGKSRALKDAVQSASTTVGEDKCFSLDLRSFGSETRLYDAIFKSKEMEEWLSGTHRLHLFLDSFDECLLRVDTVATLLADELKPEKCPIDRLSFRIASRTAEFPRSLENHLLETWGRENFQVYELCPLQASDAWEAAKANEISPKDFFNGIVEKNAGTLAARPITLRFLLNLYQKNNRFPDKLTELYEQGCRILCDEQNEERRPSEILKGSLTANQRLLIAARIAAVMVFCNKIAVWKEVETGDHDETDVLFRELSGFSEESANLEFPITEDAVRETLVQTGLFTARGANRLGWTHQTFAEFLAAWYVARHNLETKRVLSLITHPADAQKQITPQLQETAAWLASLRPDIFHELLETNPILLLRSDVASFSPLLRAKLVDELLRLFAEEKAADRGLNYGRLKHSGLAAQLLVVIKDREANYLARRFAIDVAEACELRELQNDLADIILDATEPDYVRANAGYALWRVGDVETRKRIKHFALNGSPNDKDDRVRGVALLCNWNDNMSAEDAFASIVHSPQLHDSYSLFLGHFTEKLRTDDLPVALRWIKANDSNFRDDYAVERVIDNVMLMAWQNLDTPEVISLFAEASLARLRNYGHDIIDPSHIDQPERFEQNLSDPRKRHAVLKMMLPLLDSDKHDWFFVSDSRILRARVEDLPWLLDELNNAKAEEDQKLWLQVLASFYSGWGVEPKALTILYEAYQHNEAVKKYYSWVFTAVQLGSPEAIQQREVHERYNEPRKEREERKKREELKPPPKELLLSSLAKFENGDIDSWSQLNLELALRPYGNKQYIDYLEFDLRKLPGWQQAEAPTQERIVQAAKHYVLEGQPRNEEWVGTNIIFPPAFSGYRALFLLFAKSPEYVEELSDDIVGKWAATIVSYPLNSYGGDEMIPHRRLVEKAYRAAPEKVIEAIVTQITAANEKDEPYHFSQRLEVCWDQKFKDALRSKLTDQTLKTKCWGRILEELLEHKDTVTEGIANTELVRFVDGEGDNERALISAGGLISHAEGNAAWPTIWSAIMKDMDFGRTLVERICHRTRPANKFTENDAADFFLWIVEEFPPTEDPELPMGHAFAVTSRMEITKWRDSFVKDLAQRGTPESLAALERIAAASPELGERLHWILIEARQNVQRHTWKPLTPSALLPLLKETSPQTTPSFWKGIREWLIRNPGWVFVGAATVMAGLGEYVIGIALLPAALVAFAVHIYDWPGLTERKWARRIVKTIWFLAVVALLGFFGTVFYRMKGSKSWSNLLPTAQQGASNAPKNVPFFLTTADGTVPVSSVFGGTYSVFEDRVELTIDSASFENNSFEHQPVVIGFISGGLAIRSKVGYWRIIHSAETAQAQLTVSPSSKAFFPGKIHVTIPYPRNTDLTPFHLVLAPAIQTSETTFESKPEWCAHSEEGIFKGMSPR